MLCKGEQYETVNSHRQLLYCLCIISVIEQRFPAVDTIIRTELTCREKQVTCHTDDVAPFLHILLTLILSRLNLRDFGRVERNAKIKGVF